MKGTIVNSLTILAGGFLGGWLKQRFPEKYQQTIMQGVALSVILIGINMALKTNNVLIIIISLVLGAVLGEWIGIEERLQKFGQYLETKIGKERGRIAEGFVRASLVFCIGAMSITGALQDGLTGNPVILYAKSMLDGVTAIVFAAAMGFGVMISAGSVFLFQGIITLLASWVAPILNSHPLMITEMEAAGGLLIIGIGLNMLEVKPIRVGNLLPGVFISMILTCFFGS
ncbi:MAG TPA: DUF554 domain-containing protein [Clostridia bacterium]|nr:DUF554 domain-containing protein [Clostridia bacterium]